MVRVIFDEGDYRRDKSSQIPFPKECQWKVKVIFKQLLKTKASTIVQLVRGATSPTTVYKFPPILTDFKESPNGKSVFAKLVARTHTSDSFR